MAWGFVGCRLHLGQQVKLHSVVTGSSCNWVRAVSCHPLGIGSSAAWDTRPLCGCWRYNTSALTTGWHRTNLRILFSPAGHQGMWEQHYSIPAGTEIRVCIETKQGGGDVFLCLSVSPTSHLCFFPAMLTQTWAFCFSSLSWKVLVNNKNIYIKKRKNEFTTDGPTGLPR